MRSPNNLLLALTVLLTGAASVRAASSPEELLGALYRLNTASPSNDAALGESTVKAIATLGPGAERAAARAILGWRLLRAGKPTEAAPVYQALLDDPASPPAFTRLAGRWLTRLDREQVRAALQKAWVDDIRYPDSLDRLPKPLPPMKDRWGGAWTYHVASFKRLKSEAQRYTLESPELGADSDLATVLARPWPKEPSLRAVSVNRDAGATPVVTFQSLKDSSSKITMTEGKNSGDFVLVKAGPRVLIVVEGDYFYLLANPGK